MKTKTTDLTALAAHLTRISANSRGHGGHGWTYDEEIEMLRGAAEEIANLRKQVDHLVTFKDALIIQNRENWEQQDAWRQRALVAEALLSPATAAPSNTEGTCGAQRR